MTGSAARPSRRGDGSLAWALLILGSALVVTIGDIVLLREATGFLTSGYNTVSIGSAVEIGAYLGASITLDVALVLVTWGVLLPLLARLPLSALQVFCLAGAVGMGLPLAFSAARYNIYAIAGDMFNVALVNRFGSPTWSSMAIEVFEEAQIVWLVGGIAITAALTWAIASLGRIERRLGIRTASLGPPRVATVWLALLPGIAVSLLLLMGNSPTLSRLQTGLKRKPSSTLPMTVAHWLADVDRDGYDLFTVPPDSDSWNAVIHPYALDWPANQIDEDGIGGDLTALRVFPAHLPPVGPTPEARPHLLVIYLESFRADLIHRDLDGRPITPFLRRLAEEGAASAHTFVHSPWTLGSRFELFSGSLVTTPGQTTLIDDFKSWGYSVLHFSGQDESYGDSETLLGTARADRFYDARQDKHLRTSRSTAPASLQISWKTLLARVEEGLGEIEMDRPLFLYVNIVDTHFPYHHAEIDDLLGVPPLRRDEIRSHSAKRVVRAYENTAANVDHAAERVVAEFRARIGSEDHGILVISDHGESFYERGLLGHGQSIDPAETRVPLILWGIGGEWPEPIAPSDIRGLLRRNLPVGRGATPPRPHFVPDPERRVLQFVPGVEEPTVIALRGHRYSWTYDFVEDRFERIDPSGARTVIDPAEEPEIFVELVSSWESLKLARAQRRDR